MQTSTRPRARVARRFAPALAGLSLVLALTAPPATATPANTPTELNPGSTITRIDNNGVTPSCTGCGFGRQTQIVDGPRRVNNRFVRYLTPAWSPAAQYTWGTTTTVSSTLSASVGVSASDVSSSIGATKSTSAAWSVTVTIPANSKRQSKLTLASDYRVYDIRTRQMVSGIGRPWQYATLYSPIPGEQILRVTYR